MDPITSKAAKLRYLLRQLKRADVNAKDLIGLIARVYEQCLNTHVKSFIVA